MFFCCFVLIRWWQLLSVRAKARDMLLSLTNFVKHHITPSGSCAWTKTQLTTGPLAKFQVVRFSLFSLEQDAMERLQCYFQTCWQKVDGTVTQEVNTNRQRVNELKDCWRWWDEKLIDLHPEFRWMVLLKFSHQATFS